MNGSSSLEYTIRRSERSDAKLFKRSLLAVKQNEEPAQAAFFSRFGNVNLEKAIDESPFCITVLDVSTNKIIGMSSVSALPPKILTKGLQEIQKLKWDDFVASNYGSPQIKIYNTVFLSFFYVLPGWEAVCPAILHQALQTFYCNVNDLENILFLLPVNLPLFQPLSSNLITNPKSPYFQEIKPLIPNPERPNLFLSQRQEILPRLIIRKAKVEDCDDLMPLFKVHGEKLVAKFDDYSLSQLIEDNQNIHKTYVAESNGMVVGFISMTSETDLESIEKNFDTSILPNFKLGDDVVNGFYITIFCMDSAYLGQVGEFLRVSFSEYPDLDYCLISIPNSSNGLSLLKYFHKVPSKSELSSRHSLYVLNRMGWASRPGIKILDQNDNDRIMKFVSNFNVDEQLFKIKASKEADDSCSHDIFLGYEDEGKLVAIVNLEIFHDVKNPKSEEHPFNLYRHFLVEDFCNLQSDGKKLSHARLKSFLIQTSFVTKFGCMLKDICRVLQITSILMDRNSSIPLNHLENFVLRKFFYTVKPVQAIQYPANDETKSHFYNSPLVSLFLYTINKSEEWKVEVNYNIVVVGASTTGLAFFEKLRNQNHLNFNHLYLVSPKGLPSSAVSDMECSTFDYDEKRLENLGMALMIKVNEGSVNEIDRDNRIIRTVYGSVIKYDFLVLTTGLQFNAADWNPNFSRILNVESLSFVNQENIYEKADSLDTIVIYGSYLSVLNALHGLIKRNPKNTTKITAIVTPDHDPIFTLDKKTIDKIFQTIKGAGVTVLDGSSLIDWQVSNECLNSIKVKDQNDAVHEIRCKLILYCHKKLTDESIFEAVCNANLVVDERLVIDEFFQTNDSKILAAGPMTKYSSKYNTNWGHSACNSREVGFSLAQRILALLDFTGISEPFVSKKYTEPVKLICKVPGNHEILFVERPMIKVAGVESKKSEGRELITDTESAYSRIKLDLGGWVEGITVFSKQDSFNHHNISRLFGVHEKCLNHLQKRFDGGLIPNILSFLQEPWAYPIYFHEFNDFMKRLREDIIRLSNNENAIISDLSGKIEKKENLSNNEREELYQQWEKGEYYNFLQDKLTEYLNRAV